METWRESRLAFEGPIFRVRTGTVELDDGRTARRDVVEHNGGVAVVAVRGESVLLIRQFRIAVGRTIVEIPAGKIEPGDDPASRAALELEEETGYRAGRLVPAADYFSTAGFVSERMWIYFAFDLEHIGQRLEHDERVEVIEMPLAEAFAALDRRDFHDSKTIIGLRELQAYLAQRKDD